MTHPLESARLKVGRAREHLRELDTEFAAFLDGQPYLYVPVYDGESGHHEVRVKKLADPPIRLGLLAGDAAHNLRSALDHLIYEMAALSPKGVAARGERTAFPLCEDRQDFQRRKAELLKGVPNRYWASIEEIQPYKMGVIGHPLLNLARLDDRHKHRTISTAAAMAGVGQLTPFLGKIQSMRIPPGRVYLDDGAVLCRFETVPKSDVGVNFTLQPSLVFEGNKGTLVTLADFRDIISTVLAVLGTYSQAWDAPP